MSPAMWLMPARTVIRSFEIRGGAEELLPMLPTKKAVAPKTNFRSAGVPRRTGAFEHEPHSIPRRLIDLEVMHLAFLAAGRDRHAYASAGVGAACGPVPAFLIGVDQIAIFPVHHTFT